MSDFVPEVFGGWTLEKRRGDTNFYLARKGSDTEVWASAHSDDLNVENTDASFYSYPPIVSIERLLALRRAALAPEAQAPSGEPWRPAVGEMCFYYTVGEWRLCRRLEDDDSDIPQRFEKTDRRGSSICHCDATYDGIRPLGSLPVPPSCGGEPKARERVGRPVVASERVALVRLLEWARAKEDVAESSAQKWGEGEKYSEHSGRGWAYEDCAEAIEREIAALGPPSIAEDLRAPEPGAFEGAALLSIDDPRTMNEAWRPSVDEASDRRAVREALAELRGELESNSSSLSAGLRFAVDAIDRFAARFKS